MTDPIGRREFLDRTAASAAGLAFAAIATPHYAGAAEGDPPRAVQVAVLTHEGGAHLSAYFQGLAETEEVESVVLADPDGNAEGLARQALGEKLAKVYQDRAQLFANESPTMALVSVEARLGPDAIDAALDAGCHVFAEKPACVNADDFARVAAKAESKGLYLMLALANRLNPEVQEAKRIIAEDLIGKVYGVDMRLIEDQTRLTSASYHQSWFADKARAGGGHLAWLGIHWLDLAMYITGSAVEQVAGFAGNVGGQPIDIEDAVAMSMRFDNGAVGTLASGYYLDKGYESQIKIWGSKGWLSITSDAPRTMMLYTAANGMTEFTGSSDHVAYTAFVRAAVSASAGLQDPPITTEESLRAVATVYRSYKAAVSGMTVTIE
jgi:predicted dehydrogenase